MARMEALAAARRGISVARGLRWLVHDPVTLEEARRTVAAETAARGARFLRSLEALVWPYPRSPARVLLEHAGAQRGDVAALVETHGLERALELLRDEGVYVSYEEYLGRAEARRGSEAFSFRPSDFVNPVTRGDYLGATGGSRSGGLVMELSFAWQRRQGVQRAIQHALAGVTGAPLAVWLPAFPAAAGFGAVMKNAAGGNRPERWFSQTPTALPGVAARFRLANRLLPALNALARTGLPSPEHVPTSNPAPVVAWLRDALERAGRAALVGYASSVTAAACHAADRGIDLRGVVAFPSSEPVTAGKLRAMRAAGMRPYPMYAFVPEGTVALACGRCADEEYHLWQHELALVTRRRMRDDGEPVQALLWTSLAKEAPRVLLNVENDDYGDIRPEPCDCPLGELGLDVRLSSVRGLSKVVGAGVTVDGGAFDELVDLVLPDRLGGRPGDYQFVEEEEPSGTVITLRIAPTVGDVDERKAVATVVEVVGRTNQGRLATGVWSTGALRVVRAVPTVTAAGKRLSFERLPAKSSVRPERAQPTGR